MLKRIAFPPRPKSKSVYLTHNRVTPLHVYSNRKKNRKKCICPFPLFHCNPHATLFQELICKGLQLKLTTLQYDCSVTGTTENFFFVLCSFFVFFVKSCLYFKAGFMTYTTATEGRSRCFGFTFGEP